MEKSYFESILPRLLEEMQKLGYSKNSIRLMRIETNWIINNIEQFQFSSITEICIYRSEIVTKSILVKNSRRWLYSLIQEFFDTGKLSTLLKYNPLFKRGAKYFLQKELRVIFETYHALEEQRSLKLRTVKAHDSSYAQFLLFIQNKGFTNLKSVQEEIVLSFFLDEHKKCRLSRSVCAAIKHCLLTSAKEFEDCFRIAEYIPLPKQKKKNIQFLTKEESQRLHSIFSSSDSSLSLRNKAIAAILFYMGVRAGDIANLRLSNIDWKQDLIVFRQEKTDVLQELPLLPVVGNAIYDYIKKERPTSNEEYIFLKAKYPYPPLGSKGLWEIANKIYDSIHIRQETNDRRGTHLFRHRLATALVEKGVSRTVVSSTLGHVDPTSINAYLSAEIDNLRLCSLSVETFAVEDGVYGSNV